MKKFILMALFAIAFLPKAWAAGDMLPSRKLYEFCEAQAELAVEDDCSGPNKASADCEESRRTAKVNEGLCISQVKSGKLKIYQDTAEKLSSLCFHETDPKSEGHCFSRLNGLAINSAVGICEASKTNADTGREEFTPEAWRCIQRVSRYDDSMFDKELVKKCSRKKNPEAAANCFEEGISPENLVKSKVESGCGEPTPEFVVCNGVIYRRDNTGKVLEALVGKLKKASPEKVEEAGRPADEDSKKAKSGI